MSGKEYIGDGVYVDFDGYNIVLTTENGISVTNTIVLDPTVIKSMLTYIKDLKTTQGNVLWKRINDV
jgi:hypothetical protein